jgi:hypothetical protein
VIEPRRPKRIEHEVRGGRLALANGVLFAIVEALGQDPGELRAIAVDRDASRA